MLFPRVFFIDRFTGETKRFQNPPNQGASIKLNCHFILGVAAKFCVNSAVNAVPFSDYSKTTSSRYSRSYKAYRTLAWIITEKDSATDIPSTVFKAFVTTILKNNSGRLH